MNITSKLTMELTQNCGSPIIYAVQDDKYSRKLELSLLENDEPWIIPEDVSVVIRYSKSDGKGGEYDTLPDESTAWSAEENNLTITLAPQVLTTPGAVNLSVILIQGQIQISTFSIVLYVEAAVHTMQGESEEYIHVPGFLPAPASAQIGQYLQITSVDANGHVTCTKAVTPAYRTTEPEEEDIPKVFFGAALPQTKDDTIMSFRYISRTEDISGWCKTKAQGSSSMSYPKKNQTVKLYADEFCTEKLKVNFKGWGEQSKFCFKANWIDLTHARNVVSARLWGDVVKSRSNYETIPELLRISPNQGAVDGFPVKVYAGGIYQGRYTLNIPKDAWMANMDDSLDNHCILCGEGYVSGCFREESVAQWTDEVHDTMPAAIQTRWLEVINFVMNSTDEEFAANIDSYIDLESLIDYHLFNLACCGLDAFGKNQLYHTYDGQKWYASMYDMDSTWGLYWDGSSILPTEYPRTSYEDFVSAGSSGDGNLLYLRLEALFADAIKARWTQLKAGPLSVCNIINRFERFTDIAPPYLVEEDYAATTADGAFTAIPSQDTNNIQQIRKYVVDRAAYVDGLLFEESDILFEVTQDVELNGIDANIDTGVSTANLDAYTVVVDFTPLASTGFAIDNYGNSCGWLMSANGFDFNGVPVVTFEYGEDFVGKRQKLFVRKDSTGNMTWFSANGSRLGLPRSFTDGDTGERIIIGSKLYEGNFVDFATMTVHEVKVYNRALSDEEISAMMPESAANINDGVYEDGRFFSTGEEGLDNPNYSFRNANYLPVEGGKTIVYEIDGKPDDYFGVPILQLVQYDADKNIVVARTDVKAKMINGEFRTETPDSLVLDASTAFIRGCFYLGDATNAKLRDTIRMGIYCQE